MLGSMLSLFFLTIIVYDVAAQVAGPGKCPKVESKKDFNLDKFLGKWYEIAKFFTLFEIKCSEATYTKDSTSGEVKVNNKGIERVPPPEMFMPPPNMKGKLPPHAPHRSLSQDSSHNAPDSNPSSRRRRRRRREDKPQSSAIPSFAKGKTSNLPPIGQYPLKDLPKIELVDIPTEAEADIVIADPNEPAKFTLNFTKGPQTDFQIVDTDYSTYAIIWSCHDMFDGSFNAQFSSILSRQRTLDDETLEKAKKKMSSFGIDIQRFELADQKNCPDEIKVPTKGQGFPKLILLNKPNK